jgi:hypothetical protein
MKTISKAELIIMGAHEKTLSRFIEQTGDTHETVLISSLFNGKNTISDLMWLAGEICTIEKIRKFARDVAMVNVELIKPYYIESDYGLILNSLKTGENAPLVASIQTPSWATARADAAALAISAAATANYVTISKAASYAYDVTGYATDAGEINFTPHLKELFS